jgi:small subunit ribosomal protein S21
MLRIVVKPEENIDRALKRYRLKVRKTKQLQQLRSNGFFTKKSIERREEIAKAKYKQVLKDIEDN